jgi:hypothetical protein
MKNRGDAGLRLSFWPQILALTSQAPLILASGIGLPDFEKRYKKDIVVFFGNKKP